MIIASGCPAGRAAESGNFDDHEPNRNGARGDATDGSAGERGCDEFETSGWIELLAVLRNGGPSAVLTAEGEVRWTGGQIPGHADFDSQRRDGFWELFAASSRRELLEGVNAVSASGLQQSLELAWAPAAYDDTGTIRVSVCRSPIRDRDGGPLVVVQFAGVDDSGALERTLRLEQTLARIVDELGRLHMTEQVAGDDDGLTPMPTCPLPDALSTRRSEVARLVLTGRSIPQVAEALNLSEHTVRNHLKAVYRVLGVSSRSEFLRRYHA